MNVSTERAHELYDLGLAYIRASIRANLAEVDSEIAAAGILHPAWSRRLPPPDVVPVSVMPAHAPVVTVEFTGREIQDSWRGVECAEACRKIRSFANEYARLRTQIARYPGRREAGRAPERTIGMTPGGMTTAGMAEGATPVSSV